MAEHVVITKIHTKGNQDAPPGAAMICPKYEWDMWLLEEDYELVEFLSEPDEEGVREAKIRVQLPEPCEKILHLMREGVQVFHALDPFMRVATEDEGGNPILEIYWASLSGFGLAVERRGVVQYPLHSNGKSANGNGRQEGDSVL